MSSAFSIPSNTPINPRFDSFSPLIISTSIPALSLANLTNTSLFLLSLSAEVPMQYTFSQLSSLHILENSTKAFIFLSIASSVIYPCLSTPCPILVVFTYFFLFTNFPYLYSAIKSLIEFVPISIVPIFINPSPSIYF